LTKRILKPNPGPRVGPKTDKELVRIRKMMDSLLQKAEHFLAGHFVSPTGEELTALRLHLNNISIPEAAKEIGVSDRTWWAREKQGEMKISEFSLLILFLLRQSIEWTKLSEAVTKIYTPKKDV
jgi:predicted DNA-binding protein (UPF0251 family)